MPGLARINLYLLANHIIRMNPSNNLTDLESVFDLIMIISLLDIKLTDKQIKTLLQNTTTFHLFPKTTLQKSPYKQNWRMRSFLVYRFLLDRFPLMTVQTSRREIGARSVAGRQKTSSLLGFSPILPTHYYIPLLHV